MAENSAISPRIASSDAVRVEKRQNSLSISEMALDMDLKAVEQIGKKKRAFSDLIMNVERSTDKSHFQNAHQSFYKAGLQGASAIVMTACKIVAASLKDKYPMLEILNPIADLGIQYSSNGIVNLIDGRSAQIGGVVQRGRGNEESLKQTLREEQFLQAHEMIEKIARLFQAVAR